MFLAGLDPTLLNFASFALMALEGAGIPGIPGVIPMLAQVASIDAGHTTLFSALLWGVLGNWLGSLAGYSASRWGQRWIPERWAGKLQNPKTLDLLARHGGLLIIVSRTIGSLRTPVTLMAGMTAYPLAQYALYSLLGAILHVGLWQTLLLKFGPAILPHMERWGREILLGAAVIGLLVWLYQRWKAGQRELA